jgi:hypothetical protein
MKNQQLVLAKTHLARSYSHLKTIIGLKFSIPIHLKCHLEPNDVQLKSLIWYWFFCSNDIALECHNWLSFYKIMTSQSF